VRCTVLLGVFPGLSQLYHLVVKRQYSAASDGHRCTLSATHCRLVKNVKFRDVEASLSRPEFWHRPQAFGRPRLTSPVRCGYAIIFCTMLLARAKLVPGKLPVSYVLTGNLPARNNITGKSQIPLR